MPTSWTIAASTPAAIIVAQIFFGVGELVLEDQVLNVT